MSRDNAVSADEEPPLAADAPGISADLTAEAFRIASEHLSETEILNCVTTLDQGRQVQLSGPSLENQDTSLGEIMEGIERYRHAGIDGERTLALDSEGPSGVPDPPVLLRESGLHQCRQEFHRS